MHAETASSPLRPLSPSPPPPSSHAAAAAAAATAAKKRQLAPPLLHRLTASQAVNLGELPAAHHRLLQVLAVVRLCE